MVRVYCIPVLQGTQYLYVRRTHAQYGVPVLYLYSTSTVLSSLLVVVDGILVQYKY